jgi:hypothetical protein
VIGEQGRLAAALARRFESPLSLLTSKKPKNHLPPFAASGAIGTGYN